MLKTWYRCSKRRMKICRDKLTPLKNKSKDFSLKMRLSRASLGNSKNFMNALMTCRGRRAKWLNWSKGRRNLSCTWSSSNLTLRLPWKTRGRQSLIWTSCGTNSRRFSKKRFKLKTTLTWSRGTNWRAWTNLNTNLRTSRNSTWQARKKGLNCAKLKSNWGKSSSKLNRPVATSKSSTLKCEKSTRN